MIDDEREDDAVARILDRAIAALRVRGTTEKKIREHLQNTIAASAARNLGITEETKISGEELLYWELTSFVECASGAAFTLEDVIPALIRHACELAGFYWDHDACTPEEARELLIKTLDKYLFLEGLHTPAKILSFRRPEPRS